MTLRLADLSPAQISVLECCNDGFPHEDSVGVEVAAIPFELHLALYSLCKLGLIEQRPGWRSGAWVRLSKNGRRIRQAAL